MEKHHKSFPALNIIGVWVTDLKDFFNKIL